MNSGKKQKERNTDIKSDNYDRRRKRKVSSSLIVQIQLFGILWPL